MWSPTITSDELYHHGILGQKWGQQNGPPYPLKPEMHSAAEKKATGGRLTREERSEARKAKRQAKHELKKQKKAYKAEAERQKILNSGNANDIQKLRKRGQISNEEYQTVFKRLENEQKLDELTAKKRATMIKKTDDAKKVLKNLDDGSSAAVNLYNRGARIWNTIAKRKGWEPQNLPIIPTGNDNQNNKDKENKK